MSDKTLISWTDHTFNIAWGCTKISPGCKNCYADTLATRYGHTVWGENGHRRIFGPKHWIQPLAWEHESNLGIPGVRGYGYKQLVFCSSMCDVFEDHPQINSEREKMWELIKATPHLDWQLLTKRANLIKPNLPEDWGNGYPNVWLGVSIENNSYLHRADLLREIPARVRFISYEPALGPLPDLDLTGIHWLIVGGESGKEYKTRSLNHAWAREVRDKCLANKTAFFFKQSSAFVTERGTSLIEPNGERWFWKQFPNQFSPPERDRTTP